MPRYKKPVGWPRYMVEKKLSDGTIAYFWQVPTKFRKRDCSLPNEPLGTDYGAAKQRCDDLLNPILDAWRHGTPFEHLHDKGTLDWLVNEFYQHRKFTVLGDSTQAFYRKTLKRVLDVQPRNLPGYDRIGQLPLHKITLGVADRIYERLCKKPDGTTRLTTANHTMRVLRRAWNVTYRAHSLIVPDQNPFARMGLKSSHRATRQATRQQLLEFVKAADDSGHAPIGTAALIAFEWLLRQADILSRFAWADYRPAERPNDVRLHHGKTSEQIWLPLEDEYGLLFPELCQRLEATIHRAPLIVMREQQDKKPGTHLPYTSHWFRKCAQRIRRHAGLSEDITFASFRHGGLTELGDADLTDQSMMALSAHKDRTSLTVYSKRTEKQRSQASRRRLVYRSKEPRKRTKID